MDQGYNISSYLTEDFSHVAYIAVQYDYDEQYSEIQNNAYVNKIRPGKKSELAVY